MCILSEDVHRENESMHVCTLFAPRLHMALYTLFFCDYPRNTYFLYGGGMAMGPERRQTPVEKVYLRLFRGRASPHHDSEAPHYFAGDHRAGGKARGAAVAL